MGHTAKQRLAQQLGRANAGKQHINLIKRGPVIIEIISDNAEDDSTLFSNASPAANSSDNNSNTDIDVQEVDIDDETFLGHEQQLANATRTLLKGLQTVD